MTCPVKTCKLPRGKGDPCSKPECPLRVPPVIDADFFYFRPSGKWKYHGEGRWPDFGVESPSHEALRKANGGAPGIIGSSEEFMVVCIPKENCQHIHGFPRIIRPTK